MQIPSRFEAILSRERPLRAVVDQAVHQFGEWFANSAMPFFPEYTNHGIPHLENVLTTADWLVTEDALGHVTAADVATFILAVLLHDAGMHLTEDGFRSLVEGTEPPACPHFDEESWPDLWLRFVQAARRWDDRKCRALFGDDYEPVREPPVSQPNQLNGQGRRLIGEFLRIHHPRLAHEMALTGVPGPDPSNRLRLLGLGEDLYYLIGLVARSHGLPLRAALDHVKARYPGNHRSPCGVHVVYLMGLLRLADYLDVDHRRASPQALQVRELRSPVSRQEWAAHGAVRHLNTEIDDQEALFIQAKPHDALTFERVRTWLDDFQEELDTCWAVLGEVYGRVRPELGTRGLTLRRLSSNLDDESTFTSQVAFRPRPARIRANPDITRHLIGPLYGENPAIGIRELLQNALDAVRERWAIEGKPKRTKKTRNDPEHADVLITLTEHEDGSGTLTVRDCGVGMTEEVIRDYFLVAGATYRDSDSWKRQFVNDEGSSRVLRSGRFGIGFLAAFLLGQPIHVTTRHLSSGSRDQALHFTVNSLTDPIELRNTSHDIGTSIEVTLDERITRLLAAHPRHPGKEVDWDWYCLDEPRVLRLVRRDNEAVRLQQKLYIPLAGVSLPPEWRRIEHPDFQDVQWSGSVVGLKLSCNGMKVDGPYARLRPVAHQLRSPALSIYDPAGQLPLNIARTDLSAPLPFHATLRDDMLRDYITYLLVAAPGEQPDVEDALEWLQGFGASGPEGSVRRTHTLPDLFICQEGIGCCDPSAWKRLGMDHIVLILDAPWGSSLSSALPDWPVVLLRAERSSLPTPNAGPVLAFLAGRGRSASSHVGDVYSPPTVVGARLLLPDDFIENLRTRRLEDQLGNIKQQRVGDEYTLISTGQCVPSRIDFEGAARALWVHPREGECGLLAEWFLQGEPADYTSSRLAQLWEEVLGPIVIPWDRHERETKLAHAYQKLAPYVDRYRSLFAREAARREEASRKKARRSG